MIVASCPLRISLVGGSTDHPKFIDTYERGSVISFPSNLRTYVVINRDKWGINSINKKYIINYSIREEVSDITDIKNELVKKVFEYFDLEHIHCSLTSDIYSAGSGLAASSAYLLALIKCVSVYKNKNLSDFDVCKIAEQIEKTINPLVGQQDFYGSLGGLKRIDFIKNKDPQCTLLNASIFDKMDLYLLRTDIIRNSTTVLQNLDIAKSVVLLRDVCDLQTAIESVDIDKFNNVINRTWTNKKQTSPQICGHEVLKSLDNKLTQDNRILSHKLCGAGNGGYFLIFANKNSYRSLIHDYAILPIHCSDIGLQFHNLTKL
jgi:D-glycero-alpha-D-manno-heptose-7-phosphate kinase